MCRSELPLTPRDFIDPRSPGHAVALASNGCLPIIAALLTSGPPQPMHSLRSRIARLPGLLPALLAWLLLSAQVPWHTGMSAGTAAASSGKGGLAASLGLACGPAADERTLRALLNAGQIDAAEAAALAADAGSADAGLTLCDLFTGLAAPLAVAPDTTSPAAPGALPATALVARICARDSRRLPPARAPPTLQA